jgi:prepilin-type N-terminal cleavage/methylation domain-containing protein
MKSHRSGFTLTELLVAMALMGMISVVVLAFYIQSLQGGNATDQQIRLAGKMRSFMNELIFTGSRSHELILYKSADAADRTVTDDDDDGIPDSRLRVTNEDTETVSDDLCPTGDFAVFVYYELPKPASSSQYRIKRIVGYYVDEAAADGPALTRITIDLESSPSTLPVETILANQWASAPRMVIAGRITPLALADTAADGDAPNLFYRRANQSMAVCGQMLASASGKDTADRRSYTRTFYFTVTVRT